jgi:hypothetical protein
VTALPAPDDTLKHGCTVAGYPARLVSLIFRMVIAQHGLDLFETFPVEVDRITVFHDDFPF